LIEINAALFTLLVEGFALACAFLLVSFVRGAWRSGRDRKALRALVANINQEAGARLERTRELLEDGDSATALSNHERGVCQAFIGAYNKRAAGSVINIYTQLKTLVDAYQQQLEDQRGNPVSEPPAGDPAESPKDAVIEKLKTDYETTIKELHKTKSTMDKMLREYNSMFAGGSGEEKDSEMDLEAREILQLLESGEVDDAGDAVEVTDEQVDRDAEVESETR